MNWGSYFSLPKQKKSNLQFACSHDLMIPFIYAFANALPCFSISFHIDRSSFCSSVKSGVVLYCIWKIVFYLDCMFRCTLLRSYECFEQKKRQYACQLYSIIVALEILAVHYNSLRFSFNDFTNEIICSYTILLSYLLHSSSRLVNSVKYNGISIF